MAKRFPIDFENAIEEAVLEGWLETGEPLMIRQIADRVDFSETTVRKHVFDVNTINWTKVEIPMIVTGHRRVDAVTPGSQLMRKTIKDLREALATADTQAHLRGVTNDKLREDVVKLEDRVDWVTQRASAFRAALKGALGWLKANNDMGRLPPDGTGQGVIDDIEKTIAPKEKN
jgi:hypothetical protein